MHVRKLYIDRQNKIQTATSIVPTERKQKQLPLAATASGPALKISGCLGQDSQLHRSVGERMLSHLPGKIKLDNLKNH